MAIKVLILLNNDLKVIPPGTKRTEPGPSSPFCKALNAMAQMEGDEMYMTTGFHSAYSYIDLGKQNFTDNIIKGFSKYKNTNLRLLAGSYTDGYGKALDDCIKLKCTHGTSASGEYEPNCHPKRYKNFYNDLAKSLAKTNIVITPHIYDRWHSKVSYKMAESKFVALILGSSNISTPALTKYTTSNTECDILIYDDQYDSTVQEELKDEMGKTVFNMGLTGINQISSIVKNSTDSKEIFKYTLSDSNGVNETQTIIPIINEIVEGVQNCYFKLAKPLNQENI